MINRLGVGFRNLNPTYEAIALADSFESSDLVNYAPLTTPPISIYTNSPLQSGSSKIGTFQSNLFHESSTQISITEIGFIHEGLSQASSTKRGSPELGSSEISFSHFGTSQAAAAQVGSTKGGLQVSSIQPSLTQIDSTPVTFQPRSTEVNFTQINSLQGISINISPSENPLTLSVAADHFINRQWNIFGHELTSDTNNPFINNVILFSWTSLLQGTTPFNLNFEIKDLPTGQLAEASLTGYDSSGRPNSGILLLDYNGNGLGWFTDPTPFENSEFSLSLTDSAFKATQGSAAYGRYDLLTTILHEMGHLAGIISGNPNYDQLQC